MQLLFNQTIFTYRLIDWVIPVQVSGKVIEAGSHITAL